MDNHSYLISIILFIYNLNVNLFNNITLNKFKLSIFLILLFYNSIYKSKS